MDSVLGQKMVGLLGGVLLVGIGVAEAGDRRDQPERVEYSKGPMHRTFKGMVKGKSFVDYPLAVQEGQEMEVELKASKSGVYFNIMPKGQEEAIFRGSSEGAHYRGKVAKSGEYRVRVYLMGGLADSGKEVSYEIELGVLGKASAATEGDGGVAYGLAMRKLDGHTVKFKDHSGEHQIEFLQGGEYRKTSVSQNGVKKEKSQGKWTYQRLKPDQAKIVLDGSYALTVDFENPLEGKGKWDGDVREYGVRFFREDGE